MVAKIARFEWEIPGIIHETRAYMLLEGTGLAPRFLGHIQEHGRVIGFLLEKVDRMRRAGLSDLARCRDALRAFHQITAMQHGDVNRHNFLVSDGERGKVVLIDFERSRSFSCVEKRELQMEKEIQQLTEQLTEETGRGGGFIFESGDEADDA